MVCTLASAHQTRTIILDCACRLPEQKTKMREQSFQATVTSAATAAAPTGLYSAAPASAPGPDLPAWTGLPPPPSLSNVEHAALPKTLGSLSLNEPTSEGSAGPGAAFGAAIAGSEETAAEGTTLEQGLAELGGGGGGGGGDVGQKRPRCERNVTIAVACQVCVLFCVKSAYFFGASCCFCCLCRHVLYVRLLLCASACFIAKRRLENKEREVQRSTLEGSSLQVEFGWDLQTEHVCGTKIHVL